MNDRQIITVSWLLWSSGYYLYYPFYSLLAKSVIGEGSLGTLFFLLSAVAVFLPLIGIVVGEKLKARYTIVISLTLSGLGVMLIPTSRGFVDLYLVSVLSYSFFLGLPSYYSVMARIGEGTISLVWAISILPSLIFPAVGGILITYFGFTLTFVLAGLIVALGGLVNLGLRIPPLGGKGGRPTLIPMIVIVPIAIIMPYFTPFLESFGLSYEEIGILVSASELLGMLLTLYLRNLGYLGLPLAILVFSLVGLMRVNPWFGISFGAWEAIIPLSLDYAVNDRSIRGYGIIVSSQQVGWLVGYAVGAALRGSTVLITIASLVSIALAFLTALLTRRAHRGQKAS